MDLTWRLLLTPSTRRPAPLLFRLGNLKQPLTLSHVHFSELFANFAKSWPHIYHNRPGKLSVPRTSRLSPESFTFRTIAVDSNGKKKWQCIISWTVFALTCWLFVYFGDFLVSGNATVSAWVFCSSMTHSHENVKPIFSHSSQLSRGLLKPSSFFPICLFWCHFWSGPGFES